MPCNYFIYNPCLSVLIQLNGEDNFIVLVKKDEWKFYMNHAHCKKMSLSEIAKFYKNTKYLFQTYNSWKGWNQTKLLPLVERAKKVNVKNLSDKELLELNEQLGWAAHDYWLNPIFIDIFDPCADEIMLEEIKKSKLTINPQDLKTLLKPERKTVFQEYKTKILDYLLSPKDKQDAKLKKILADFDFVASSYAQGDPLTKRHVNHEINHINLKLAKRELTALKNYKKNLKKQKQQIIIKLNLHKRLALLFQFFSFLAYWRDERKAVLQKTVIGLNILGQEITVRSRLPWKEVCLVPPTEIKSLPVKKSLIQKYKKLLRDNYLLVYDHKGKKTVPLSKTQCEKIMKILRPKNSEAQSLSGKPAFLGRVKGKVRIIDWEKDFSKFKKGEILVTAMTRPEFMSILRKASAIVTDEGGITCHAAIVSRELKIPCVIGTQTATKLLKDGDLVEVDANRGIVKIIKKWT